MVEWFFRGVWDTMLTDNDTILILIPYSSLSNAI